MPLIMIYLVTCFILYLFWLLEKDIKEGRSLRNKKVYIVKEYNSTTKQVLGVFVDKTEAFEFKEQLQSDFFEIKVLEEVVK